MNNYLPPANIEAEEAILGGILLDSNAMSRIEAELKVEAFYVEAHQEIYRAALALYRQMKPTDLVAVSTYLNDRYD
jgi:replicative DNA helicase